MSGYLIEAIINKFKQKTYKTHRSAEDCDAGYIAAIVREMALENSVGVRSNIAEKVIAFYGINAANRAWKIHGNTQLSLRVSCGNIQKASEKFGVAARRRLSTPRSLVEEQKCGEDQAASD